MNFSTNSTAATCFSCLHVLPHSHNALLIANSLFDLPVKSWALWLMATSPSFVTERTDIFNFSLMVNDFLLSLIGLLGLLSFHLFRRATESILSFVGVLLVLGRPMFQCCVCVERYLAVKFPVSFIRCRPLRYRAHVLAPAWSLVLLASSVSAALCSTQSAQITVIMYMQCTVLILIFIINSFCCLSILRALLRPSPGDGQRERGPGQKVKEPQKHQVKRKAFIIMALIQVLMMTCYLPAVALTFTYGLLDRRQYCIFYFVVLCFIVLSSCMYSYYRVVRMEPRCLRSTEARCVCCAK